MKQSFLIILSFILSAASVVQAQDEEKLYYMRQEQGTERLLQQYIGDILNNAGIQADTLDDVYVNFIPPMGCPRCEGVLIEYNKLLQKTLPNKQLIINVLLYKKGKALSEYIQKQNFPGDVLHIDTGSEFYRIFQVNHNRVYVPYLAKISLKHGRVITALPILGIDLDKNLVENIVGKTDFVSLYAPLAAKTQAEAPVSISLHLDNWKNWKKLFGKNTLVLMPEDSCKILGSDTVPKVYEFVVNSSGDKLIIDNSITNSFALYSKNGKQWVNPILLRPTEEESAMFIDKTIDPSIYQYLKENNVLVSMYLNSSFTKQDVYLTASLPCLEMTKKDTAYSISYSNMPVCLIKNYKGETVRSFLFDGIVAGNNYAFSHSDGIFFEEDSLFAFQLQKGWPVSGTEALPGEKEKNPFVPEFYDDSKTILFYNAHTKTHVLTAPLDSIYIKYRLGYYVNTPLVKKQNNRYYWTDIRLGKVYALSDNFESSTLVCDLFHTDTSVQQMPYSENLSYLESYAQFFKKQILDFEITDDNRCIALVTDGSHYYFYRTIDADKVNIAAFPDVIGDKTVSGLQLGRDSHGNRIAYGLYQNDSEIVIYSFDLVASKPVK